MRVKQSQHGLWFIIDSNNNIVKVCCTKESAIRKLNEMKAKQ